MSRPPLRLLSVVIPARDEEGCIASTVEHLHLELELRGVPHEIIVVDDGSTDRTWQILQEEARRLNVSAPRSTLHAALRPMQNPGPHGFGCAIQTGLNAMQGDAAVIFMADESDDCRDVVRYWEKLSEGYDCVFGSRFMKGGGTIDYPPVKLFMNRLANAFVRFLFRHTASTTRQMPSRPTAKKSSTASALFFRRISTSPSSFPSKPSSEATTSPSFPSLGTTADTE